MKLFELFDKAAEYSWSNKSANYGNAMFVTDGTTYKVIIGAHTFGNTPIWSVQFEALTWDADQWTIGNTGTGDEYTVFSTVVAVVKEFMTEYGARTIHMQTSHAGRASLYPKMLKRLLPQWRVHIDGSQIFAIKPGDETPSMDDDDEA